MAKITSLMMPRDPWEKVDVAGFNSSDDALTFVEKEFKMEGVVPVFNVTLERGESHSFPDNLWVVFYVNKREPPLFSITQCVGNSNIGSFGAQFGLFID